MAWFFEMPQASPTMEKGTLLAWRKAEGAALSPQDVIAEVETDKAAMDIEVFDAGFLLRILVPEGAEVPAGHPIAILGKSADEDVSALLSAFERLASAAPASAPAAAPLATPKPAHPEPPPPPAAEVKTAAGLVPFSWQGHAVNEAILEMPDRFESQPTPGRVRAAPAARRAAQERGVDLQRVRGTGPHGRVMRSDVDNAVATPASAPAPAPAASEQIRNTQMRKTIARRLKAAWLDAPAFYLTAVFDCDALVGFRAWLKAAGVAVSANDVLVRACALALRDEPAVNASWGEDAITRHGAVHVGVAVALPDGLITPVVRDADRKGLRAISAEIREMAERARVQKLLPEEYTGSTFTISNLGMMKIEQFTAILNPPEAVILAVGALQREPVVGADGALGVGWRMRVTLTCDHRVVDGATGARFLAALRRYVEHPALLSA